MRGASPLRGARAAARPDSRRGHRGGLGPVDVDLLRRLHNLRGEVPPSNRTCFPGVDLWRWQYFQGIRCPRSVVVPVDDPAAWQLYPSYRRVYDKLFVCDSQGIPHGPHGVPPDRFPVFSKPIMNLHGMGAGGRVVRDLRELEAYCAAWIRRHLRGFTGVVNFETIGGKIIECHLRMSEQWADLNGPGWLESVVELYASGRWRFEDARQVGYSVVLFGRHGQRYWIDPEIVEALRARPGVSSIQITYDLRRPPAQHAMPPGGFRLAIVNCWRLSVGLAVRDVLRRSFIPVGNS